MNVTAQKLIGSLGLAPLAGEGGYFRRVWESALKMPDGRAGASNILFLMAPTDFSAWHRLKSEEVWHFHSGDAVEHFQIDPRTGKGTEMILGAALEGTSVSVAVAPEVWQAARLRPDPGGHGWALMSCTVVPAWREEDFELGRRDMLEREFRAETERIRMLTR